MHDMLNLADEPINFAGRSLCDEFDAAVGQIPNETCDGEPSRDALGGIPEANALNEPGEMNRALNSIGRDRARVGHGGHDRPRNKSRNGGV